MTKFGLIEMGFPQIGPQIKPIEEVNMNLR